MLCNKDNEDFSRSPLFNFVISDFGLLMVKIIILIVVEFPVPQTSHIPITLSYF